MHRCVTANFYLVFYYLENSDLLDPLNPLASDHILRCWQITTTKLAQNIDKLICELAVIFFLVDCISDNRLLCRYL